jgi:hypothetical protein
MPRLADHIGHRRSDQPDRRPGQPAKEVKIILVLEWLGQHAPLLEAPYCWVYNRLTGSRCFAQGCGRLLLLHTPWQMSRCYDSPTAIELTDTEAGYSPAASIPTPLFP